MVIVVSSSVQNVGKTTLSMLLGFMFVSDKKKVLLVDADMGRNTLAERLGLDVRKGQSGKVFEVEELGYKFDFGFCDMHKAVNVSGYDVSVVDFDVTRSAKHGDYYFDKADIVFIPNPSWSIEKIKDWSMRFIKNLKDAGIKAKTFTYPVAVRYEKDDEVELLKWTNYDLYKAWKEKGMSLGLEKVKGILYSQDWASYISLNDYSEGKVRAFIKESIERLREDNKEWLK